MPGQYISLMIISSLLILHLRFSFAIVLSDFKMLIILCIVFIWCRLDCVISPVTGNTQKKIDFFVLECNIFCPYNSKYYYKFGCCCVQLNVSLIDCTLLWVITLNTPREIPCLAHSFKLVSLYFNMVLNLCCEGSLFSGVYVVG